MAKYGKNVRAQPVFINVGISTVLPLRDPRGMKAIDIRPKSGFVRGEKSDPRPDTFTFHIMLRSSYISQPSIAFTSDFQTYEAMIVISTH